MLENLVAKSGDQIFQALLGKKLNHLWKFLVLLWTMVQSSPLI
jgi:hypothetical protein